MKMRASGDSASLFSDVNQKYGGTPPASTLFYLSE